MSPPRRGPDWFDWLAIASVWVLIIVFIATLWTTAGAALQCPR